MLHRFLSLQLIAVISVNCLAADTTELAKVNPEQYLKTIEAKIQKFNALADNQVEKYIRKMDRIQAKLFTKLNSIDSVSKGLLEAGDLIPNGSIKSYFENFTKGNSRDFYIPYLDSLGTMVKFLEFSNGKGLSRYSEILEQLNSLKSKLYKIESFNGELTQKVHIINEYLEKYKGLSKYLTNLNKEIYYYSQVVSEYKVLLSNPERAERQLLNILSKVPQFQSFYQKYSQFFTLFSPPADYGASLTGIQSKDLINKLIHERLGANTTNPQQFLSQQMEAGKSELNKIKSEFPQLSSTNNLPNFKPNNEHAKSFGRRLEFNNNFQFKPATQYQPSFANIGFQIGYKFTNKTIAGIGMGYKLGMGSSIRRVSFTNEGWNLRSYVDWKVDKNTFFTNGFEYEYLVVNPNIPQLEAINPWSPSWLTGITRKQKVGNRLKAQCSFLFDILYNKKQPHSNPFAFRFGYSL